MNAYEFIYGKRKLKIVDCLRNVLYRMAQGTQECNGWHYPLLSSVLIEIKYLLLSVGTYWHFTRIWQYKYFILLAISTLNIHHYMYQTKYKQRKRLWPYITMRTKIKTHTFIDTPNSHICMVRVKKDNKLWSFVTHSYHQFNITISFSPFSLSLLSLSSLSLSHSLPLFSSPNNFLSTTSSPYTTIL
jgi:hypothetical protein